MIKKMITFDAPTFDAVEVQMDSATWKVFCQDTAARGLTSDTDEYYTLRDAYTRGTVTHDAPEVVIISTKESSDAARRALDAECERIRAAGRERAAQFIASLDASTYSRREQERAAQYAAGYREGQLKRMSVEQLGDVCRRSAIAKRMEAPTDPVGIARQNYINRMNGGR